MVMQHIVFKVGLQDDRVELVIIEDEEDPIVLQINGSTARELGDIIFKMGCNAG